MNDKVKRHPSVILERITENMFVVMDESRADVIVLAPTLEAATSVFDNMVAINKGELEYYGETIHQAAKLLNWHDQEVDPKIDKAMIDARNYIKAIQDGRMKVSDMVAKADAVLSLIDKVLTEDRLKSRHQKRAAYRVRKVAGDLAEKGFDFTRTRI